MLSRPVGMSLTALLLIVCFVACLAERRLLSGGSPLPRTRPVFPEPLDASPRPAESRMRRHARTASRWQGDAASSSPFSPPFYSSSSARSSGRRHSQRPHHDRSSDRHPTFWRVEEGLTLRLWKDSSHVSPTLLALRYRGAPGGMDARDLVPLGEEDSQNNEADGAGDVRNCFYSGDVVDEPGSKAVVSLCNGMTGYISSPSRGMFTVEPISWDGSGAEPQGSHGAHILRHHRDGYVSPANNNASGTHGTNSARWRDDGSRRRTHYAGHRRRRRSYSLEQHVEVLVAADSKMARYHGKNLKHYILTLMAAVAHIYKDPSIGNLLNIAVVKLLIMEEDEDNDIISPSATNTLKNFCRWQQQHNHPDDSHPYHHDTAILLTREDLCRLPKTCDTLGLAQSGMICDPHGSCAVVEDNGLSAAFTIAHELGHVLNIPHDDDQKCAKYRLASQPLHVMARMLDYNSHPWSWSVCSRHYVTTFLDAGYGACLRDSPGENLLVAPSSSSGQHHHGGGRLSHSSKQAGELFDMDEQCELVFGRGAKVCPYMPVCKRLWCTVHGHPHGGCRTQHMPWADGTSCGLKHWCQQGQCVAKPPDSERRKKIDGEWGPWQEYERCSRTCGGGIQSTRRECNSPTPAFGGRYCIGERIKYRSCNTQPCPIGSMDFREQQCSTFNGKTFNFPDVPYNPKWTAHHSGISHVDSCKLYCRLVGQSAYYVLKEKVIDGTACNPESYDVCINGICKPAGCDHQLNSTATTDMCGVCGGDNATCRTITGHFNRAEFGYNFVTVIPAGASYVDIHQFGFEKDDNYLALKSAEDEYLLNGNFTVSMFRKTLRYGGTVIEYSGSNASVERINATKPLGKELHLMVLTVGKVESPDIRFEYTMSIRDERRYYWELSPLWSDCSSHCQGHRHRRPECKRRPDGGVVDDIHCEPSTKPQSLAEACNLHCTLRWRVGEPSECSARCGNGVRTRSVQCVQRSNDGGQEAVVPDSRCEAREAKPPEVEKCGEPCRNFRWDYGDWQPCSKTCGGGEQVRSAVCLGESQERHPDSQCELSARVIKRPCNEGECPHWELGHWTECSVTCGSGKRQRPLWCQHEKRLVASSFCHPAPRPPDSEPCEMPPCEAPARWHLGEEGPCSVTCGGGVAYRNVTCRSAGGTIVDDAHCHGSPRPHEASECNRVSCWHAPSSDRPSDVTSAASEHPSTGPRSNFAAWKSAPWSQCSATCSSGVRKRQVSCINEVTGAVLPDEECVYEKRPAIAEPCDAGTCGKWQHGDWSACSSKCGPGVSSRRVQCFARDTLREVLPDTQCDEALRPKQEEPCQGPCLGGGGLTMSDSAGNHPSGNHVEGPYRWRFGQWGTCSRSCGGGTQRRQVVCVDNLESKSNACNELLRPPETQHCNTEDCPSWSLGEWTPCDQECGGGQQTRRVVCQGAIGFIDAHCPQPKPESKRACNMHSCVAPTAVFRWRPGAWSSCSVTCGSGVMKRNVECIDSSHKAAPYANCEGEPPEHTKDCTMQECPRWQLSPWSQCSAPCGNGTQKRVARCMRRGVEVSQLECHGKRPETQVRTCHLRTCHYRWKKKRWSPCSVTCGGGLQTRTVVCVDRNERQAPDRFCATQRRPKVVRHCAVQPCPFVWRTSDWSECSRTCGEGFQKRSVTCHKVNPYGWVDPTPLSPSAAAAERLSAIEAASSPHYHGGREPRVPHYCSNDKRPPNSRACMVGHCGEGVFWRPGPWTPCSTTCGPGKQKRRLRCYDQRNKRVNNSHCSGALKNRIKRKRRCMLRPCTAVSCEEVQRRGGVRKDGEQKLYVRGRLVSVYCARMNTSAPQEYISLDSGESNNYSEVYGKRLRRPDECPYGGARVDHCECFDDYPAALTTFSKVSFNITTLQVNRLDFTFSRTLHGVPTGFGGSGDCYSRAQCPQGRFSLSLSGTDFTVSADTKWVTQGTHTYHSVRRLQEGQIIQGRCGGYCGQCFPDPTVGLLLDVRPP